MLQKTPKSVFWKYFKGTAKAVFVLEAVGFACSYGIYYRMNTDQDFRRYMNENFPFVLNYYYKVGELLGGSQTRHIDTTVWQVEKKKD